uniref:HAD family hydrolase n=1 Tax=Anaerostipes hadrus TaxID=649756 RepID=UPI0040298196
TQENKIKVLEAKKDFDKIILTENLGREFWKPHPRSFEIIRKYFDVEYEEMMYVGDNPKKDFYIRAIHPITTVQICRLENVYGRCDYYEGIKPNRIINSLKELQAII